MAVTGIATGAPCPPERHRAVVHFATEVLAEIHVHHSREDDVLWPVIAASAGAAVDLEPLTDDHTELHAVLTRAEQALAAFAAPGADLRATAAPLGTVLTGMADLLDEHIAEEEAEVFPVIRTHVSAGDFAACEKRFQKGSSPAHLLFVLPWVIGQCTPAERAAVLGEAPAPLKLLQAGRADLAISYEPEVLLARDKGTRVLAVAALVHRPLTRHRQKGTAFR